MSSIRYVAAGGITFGALLYMWPRASPGVPGAPNSDAYKTTGVKNIEKAYERGGATSTHTKAYGGTIQGEAGEGLTRDGGATGNATAFDREGMGEDQRPSAQLPPEKAWNKTMYGNEKGK